MEHPVGYLDIHAEGCNIGRFIVRSSQTTRRDTLDQFLSTLGPNLGFDYRGSLREHLSKLNIDLPAIFLDNFPGYHLIEVPLSEAFAVFNFLFQESLIFGRIPRITAIEPDQALQISMPQARIGTNFSLSHRASSHATYKASLNLPNNGVDGRDVRIAIVDTGLETGRSAAAYRDMIGGGPTQADRDGHGTAMFDIVRDVAPGAEIHVFRVTDSTTVYVWDMIASVTAAIYGSLADIVSLSMGCRNLSKRCGICGGQAGNRSIVCEHFFDLINTNPPDQDRLALVVAAVGNQGPSVQFEWPAQFRSVFAVGAINRKHEIASFSNGVTQTSTVDFGLCPGGDVAASSAANSTPSNVTEWVGEGLDPSTGATTYCAGTSPATAYAAAVLALRRDSEIRGGTRNDKIQFLDNALNDAKQDIIDSSGANIYNHLAHGMGRIVYQP